MSNVIVKETLEYLESVNTPDYTDKNKYIVNPVLPNCESKYFKISGNEIVEMNQAEKTIVDNQLIEEQKIVQAEQIIQDKMRELAIQKGVDDGVLNSDGSLK